MKRKGFTLVELLVVISIIAILMAILMPALSMVRKLAQQAVCGSNLSGLHKALLTYAQANGGDYPRAGGRNSTWGQTYVWDGATEVEVFNETLSRGIYQLGVATIGASLYQLIREADVGPKSFICRGDKGAKAYNLNDYPRRRIINVPELRKGWDFGNGDPLNRGTRVNITTGMYVAQHYSYAYHIPYGGATVAFMQISTQSSPRLAVMADRSPYLVLNPDRNRGAYQFVPPVNGVKPSTAASTERWGNSTNHDSEGQNVLFNDGSVSFNKVPYCGIDDDNIYTMASAGVRREAGSLPGIIATPSITGTTPMFNPNTRPVLGDDSLLVNEGAKQGGIVPVQ